ncbi:tRNA pseudouridine synthase D TruD [Methanosalsum zhilinae DSM 4017]|uniref:Probable tRNA pseudouridine synthase D n=2 Tax=Methanosalsum zhilinae TaxID=39669 RepID=F7XPJ6_METZD|nr:tRNA pseudouridine synthase D TruD [Methanosalsum zhilinae DSM 4017]
MTIDADIKLKDGPDQLTQENTVIQMQVYDIEKQIGIELYSTSSQGTGGILRKLIEDFQVREITNRKEGFEGKYLILELTKHNWDTHHVVRELSRRLRISQKRIGFAGTKDKRAETTQKISIFDLNETDIENVHLKDVDLKVIGRSNKSIGLGDLTGNEFRITIRNIDHSKAELKEILSSITMEIDKNGGVPNYFGIQRFGSLRPITHLVGESLVKGDSEEAALKYISMTFQDEPEDTKNARNFVADTRNFIEGLKLYPHHLRYERTMMHHLVNEPGDYEGAFLILPENLRRMFVHAYQSYIFNRIISERMRRGLPLNQAVKGDVVCFKNSAGLPDTSRTEKVSERTIDGINNLIRRKRAFVTAPLIGYETEFSEDEPGEIERTIFDQTGVSRKHFAEIPVSGISSRGMRREILLNVSPVFSTEDDETSPGRSKAILEFTLPKGSYATTVLREYMKVHPLEMS